MKVEEIKHIRNEEKIKINKQEENKKEIISELNFEELFEEEIYRKH